MIGDTISTLEYKRIPLDDDPRRFQAIQLIGTSIELEVMIHREKLADRTPLLIICSIEFPMPPSFAFCEMMWDSGYQVIFCRRPGFGNLPGLPDALLSKRQVKNRSAIASESALFSLLIKTLSLEKIVLLGMGTSNSICYRLGQLNDQITFCVYANPLFHPEIWDVIKPQWLKQMIRQTLMSRSGLKIAVRGLKAILRRDPIWFYRQFAQKRPGDQTYINHHEGDYRAAGLFLQNISPNTFYYDLQNALIEDTQWDPEITRSSNAVILSGEETTEKWKRSIEAEAARLGLPLIYAPSGDLFVPYVSHEVLREILRTHAPVAAAN